MTEKKDPEAERRDLSINIAAVFMGVGLILFAANSLIPTWYSKPESAAEYGDMFGGVNALFSGLAFVGLIWAIMLQKQELGLQRQELKDTRQELAGQREQLELQNSTFKQQAFDSVFFQMLSLHNQIINGIDFTHNPATKFLQPIDHSSTRIDTSKNTVYKGRDCIAHYYEEFKAQLSRSEKSGGDFTTRVNQNYQLLYRYTESDLGHYFRNLYSIIKFVERSEIENKKPYTNIVRAQLSSSELGLLFYNCLSDYGKEKFKPLVEKYSLLKNLPDSVLVDPSHKEWYEPTAFGKPEPSEPE